MKEILIFGDSIACGYWDPEGGWAQKLRNELIDKALANDIRDYVEVYNLAIDGDNSTGLLKRLENEIKDRVSDKEGVWILIGIGTNDCEWDMEKKVTVTPKDQFEKNIKILVETAQKYAEKVVFVGFTPIDQPKVDPIPWKPNHSYRDNLNKEFNEIVRNVCRKNNLHFIDLLENLGKGFKDKLVDGVHPNSEGHEEIFQIVRQAIFK